LILGSATYAVLLTWSSAGLPSELHPAHGWFPTRCNTQNWNLETSLANNGDAREGTFVLVKVKSFQSLITTNRDMFGVQRQRPVPLISDRDQLLALLNETDLSLSSSGGDTVIMAKQRGHRAPSGLPSMARSSVVYRLRWYTTSTGLRSSQMGSPVGSGLSSSVLACCCHEGSHS